MEEKNYRLLEILGEIDDSYVDRASGPWNKKISHGWRSGLKAACAALVIACGMLGASQPQVNAAVRELFSQIGQLARREADFAPYASPMEQSQTKDGVTLTLQEVIMTDNQLYAAISMDTDLEDAEIGNFHISCKALDENIHTSYSGGFFSGSSRENGYVIKYSFEDGTLPEEAEDITLTLLVYEDSENLSDSEQISFDFTFPASGDALSQDTRKLALEQELEIKPGITLELEEISLNRIFSRIRTKCGEHHGSSLPLHRTQYFLKGTDSLGNEVLYTYEAENGPYGHFATIEELDGSLPSPDSEWIELQLYALNMSENVVTEMMPVGEKFRIDLAAPNTLSPQ